MTLVVRCEPDPERTFHCEALASYWPEATVCDLAGGEQPTLAGAARIVLTGSSAGVYEDDTHDWIADGRALVRDAIAREIPLLGVCFGHQLVHDALGGRVVADEFRAGLATAVFEDDPLFADVSPVVPVLHGDKVVESGEQLHAIASVTEYDYPQFASRHDSAPVWTVQFHPELGPAQRPRLLETFDWNQRGYTFDDVTAHRVFANFRQVSE